jgi:hypothetical protein
VILCGLNVIITRDVAVLHGKKVPDILMPTTSAGGLLCSKQHNVSKKVLLLGWSLVELSPKSFLFMENKESLGLFMKHFPIVQGKNCSRNEAFFYDEK